MKQQGKQHAEQNLNSNAPEREFGLDDQ